MAVRWIAALLLGVTAVCTSARAAAPASGPEETATYTIRRGDSLYTLADAYLVHASDYRIVQRLNHIRNPYLLPVGQLLRVPRRLLRTQPLPARLIAFRGTVTIDGAAARVGAILTEGARIQTGASAFVSFALADGSTITLPSQSAIRVERMLRVLMTGEVERSFRLESGRSESVVTPMRKPGDRLEIRTRVSVAAVRGTVFRVAVLDGGKTASTEVLDGVVAMAGSAGEVAVTRGLGARVTESNISQPISLLPPPALDTSRLAQSEPELSFRIVPLPGATRYRVQVATDAGFLDLVEEAVVEQPDATLPAIVNGDYFARVTAIDVNELEGRPRVYSFERYLNGVRATAESLPGGHRFLFRWQDLGSGSRHYRFVLAREAAPAEPLIDEPALTTHAFVATNLPQGDYVWRVQTTDTEGGAIHSNWSAPQTLTVSDLRRAQSKARNAQPPPR